MAEITRIGKGEWEMILEEEYFGVNFAFYRFIYEALEEKDLHLLHEENTIDIVWFKSSDLSFFKFAYMQMAFVRVISIGFLDEVAIKLFRYASKRFR